MADTESILQLGIEAARAGDKDEARNLFRLLTREPPRTRELSADEEFAMSLDSLGSLSATMNDRKASGADPDDLSGFNIPDFGGFGDEEVDMEAYMNRKRVDVSDIEIVPEPSK